MLEKLKELILKLNSYGLPLPFVRDPVSSAPSVSLTLLIISALIVFIGLTQLATIDIQESLYWFGICSALYFGRKMTSSGTKAIEIDEVKK